jgi:hypothetical protein
MNDELEWLWKETKVVCFKLLSCHLLEELGKTRIADVPAKILPRHLWNTSQKHSRPRERARFQNIACELNIKNCVYSVVPIVTYIKYVRVMRIIHSKLIFTYLYHSGRFV